MKLRIDGREVDAGAATTLLEACRGAGANVPTLCHDDRVTAGGHCRACMVEANGRLVPACTTPALDGAVVETTSTRVREYRRDLGELMLAESSPRGRAAELLREWGVEGGRYAGAGRRDVDEPGGHEAGGVEPTVVGQAGVDPAGVGERPDPRAVILESPGGVAHRSTGDDAGRAPRRDASHPFLRLDLGACIRCRLCVAACAEIQGQFVWAMEGRGARTLATWGAGAFDESDCVSCGACVALCPAEAISDVDRERARDAGASGEERVVRTTCSYCGVGCGLDVHVRGDTIVRIDGARTPVNGGHLCVKGRYAHRFVRHPDRLRTPLVRRDGVLEPATWDEAIAYVARGMQRLRGRVGGLSSSRCTNEENYLLQKWMRAGLGTNNVDCCARVCHAPSAAGMRLSLGTGAATNSLADIERADVLLVSGSNTTESHPVAGARVKQAVLAGAALVVVDPRRTELAALADVHLQPRPGTNVPLLNSLAAVLIEAGFVDREFLAARTEGFDEVAVFLREFAPEATEATTLVPAALVRRAARLYGEAERPMQLHGLGMTEHLQGSEGVRLLCNLALLRGAVGREGTGVNPLRGQNNVQGAADMGCQPDLLTGYAPVASAAVRERFAAVWGAPVPEAAGLSLPQMYDAIDRGEVAGLFVFGEDIVQTDPDSERVTARLASLELLVVQELFLSETARLAHVVLPAASAFEKDGTFTNGERRVQRVRRALEPLDGTRADREILVALMRECGMQVEYASPRDVFEEIRRVWPALAAAEWDALDAEGLQWPVTAQAPRGTPVLHRETFPRGRAELARVPFVPSASLAEGPLVLVTGRVLEHYNSGSMTRRSGTVELVGRDELEIHPDDAAARGIRDGDRVSVTSRYGQAEAAARVTMDVQKRTVFLSFHFPETGTNRVTSDVEDRLTGCPEYKVTGVEVRRR